MASSREIIDNAWRHTHPIWGEARPVARLLVISDHFRLIYNYTSVAHAEQDFDTWVATGAYCEIRHY